MTLKQTDGLTGRWTGRPVGQPNSRTERMQTDVCCSCSDDDSRRRLLKNKCSEHTAHAHTYM